MAVQTGQAGMESNEYRMFMTASLVLSHFELARIDKVLFPIPWTLWAIKDGRLSLSG